MALDDDQAVGARARLKHQLNVIGAILKHKACVTNLLMAPAFPCCRLADTHLRQSLLYSLSITCEK